MFDNDDDYESHECIVCVYIVGRYYHMSYRIKNYIKMRNEKVTVDGRNVSYVHRNVQCFIRSGGRFWQIFVSLWDNYLCLLVIDILSVHCRIVRIPSLFDFRSPIVS